MADCGGDQRKSRQDRKRKQRQSASEGIIKSKEMMPSGDLPNKGNVYGKPQSPWNWKTKVPAGDKHYWLAKSSNSSSSGDLSLFLDIFVLSCQTSMLKLSTSSFTHHPRVTKAHAALHPHVCTLIQLATQGFWVNLHIVWTELRLSTILTCQLQCFIFKGDEIIVQQRGITRFVLMSVVVAKWFVLCTACDDIVIQTTSQLVHS